MHYRTSSHVLQEIKNFNKLEELKLDNIESLELNILPKLKELYFKGNVHHDVVPKIPILLELTTLKIKCNYPYKLNKKMFPKLEYFACSCSNLNIPRLKNTHCLCKPKEINLKLLKFVIIVMGIATLNDYKKLNFFNIKKEHGLQQLRNYRNYRN